MQATGAVRFAVAAVAAADVARSHRVWPANGADGHRAVPASSDVAAGATDAPGTVASALLLDPVQPGPDRHRLDVADPIDTGQIAARFAERLVQPTLQLLDAHHHVQVALRVLLDHVPHIYFIFRIARIAFRCASVSLAKLIRKEKIHSSSLGNVLHTRAGGLEYAGKRFFSSTTTYCVTRAGSGSSSGSGSGSTSSLGASVTELFWLTNTPRFGSFRRVRSGVPAVAPPATEPQLTPEAFAPAVAGPADVGPTPGPGPALSGGFIWGASMRFRDLRRFSTDAPRRATCTIRV
uniref:Secreted protein n=1 Tax=Anopheles culicifacies TaxID=139723 RepID=A0A182MKJ1_9DIPT